MAMLQCVVLMGYSGDRLNFLGGKKHDLIVKSIPLIAHGNARASMLPSSKIGLESTRISDALLVDTHHG